jgi:hypothetical protein
MAKESISDEIAESMRRSLFVNSEDSTHELKLTNAIECLNKAAEILDDIGLENHAEVVTILLEKIASK